MPEPRDNRGEMPFLDHLEELRWRILYSLLAVVVGTLVGWVIVEHVDVIGLLIEPIKPLIPGGKLRVTSPTDPFFITLQFAFVTGLVLASPIVGYQIWAFLAPALYERERRLIVPALSIGAVLFLGGAAAAFRWLLPRALTLLLSFQQGVFDPLITAGAYFGFAAKLIIAVGLFTELPLVIIILAALGLVTPQFLARNRRYALAVAAVAAALLAPPDAVSMLGGMVLLAALYEVSIWCAWVVTKRRARRAAGAGGAGEGGGGEGGGGGAGSASLALVALLVLAAAAGTRALAAQTPPNPPNPPFPQNPLGPGAGGLPTRSLRPPGAAGAVGTDTGRTARDSAGQGRTLDTATARRLGLPTGPSRSFPASDRVIDSLLKLKGYRITQYVADTLIVQGGDTQTIHLRGAAYVDREGTRLESDSIRYYQKSCRLDAVGDPRLFDKATVLVGEGMRYDTCVKRGTVHNALTEFQQGGARWYVRGDLAVDSGQTRLYGANTLLTTDENPVPDYHFATGEMKWLSKNVMVARPAVLYIHDVPIMWLPFIFDDVRKGRRSGILRPRFGLSDIVRPTRSYSRHVANLGYYFVVNDYVDFLVSGDWYAGRYLSVRGQTRYKWLDRFIDGGLSFERYSELDVSGNSIRLGWQHRQSFSSRTTFTASVDYSTRPSVIYTNTVNPFLATASLHSQLSFNRQFDWGTLSVGGDRSQEIGSGLITQTFPSVSLTPAPLNLTPSITWSPGFSYTNQQSFHQLQAPLLVPGGASDTLFYDTRSTNINFQTPLRVGPWVWVNSFSVADLASNARQEFDVPDTTALGGRRRLLYARTFSTAVEWQTGINLPSLFTGTWKLQPGIAIVNQTSAGPFMVRNQFTGGNWVTQGKRLQFNASLSPTLFGFFPGFGPVARIRHSISPLISYAYAPGATVSAAYQNAIDPTHQLLNSGSDPQQNISLGLSQNFEAKLKPPAGDTSARAVKKLRILSINTSPITYNFEQAKQPHRTGWQTQTLSNNLASDLLPGFNFSITHDLWAGQVGTDSARFDPFLTSVQAGFTLSGATLASVARLFGLGGKGSTAPPPTAPPAGPPGPAGPAGAPGLTPDQGAGQYGPQGIFPPVPFAGVGAGTGGFYGPAGGAGGQGFNLGITYTQSRARPLPTTAAFGTSASQQMTLNLSFQPTPHWSATWASSYDFISQQFGMHVIHLERDLHRWHASFSFTKAPNGNFAFSFFVSLLDQPDIKFDYAQQSFFTR